MAASFSPRADAVEASSIAVNAVAVRNWRWGSAAAPTRSHYWITAPDGTGAPDRPNVQLPDMRLIEDSRDLDLLVGQAGALRAIAPDVDRWGLAHHIAGLSMYTPNGKFIVGPVPGLEGFLIAGGCCGSGIAGSGGFGQSIAELVTGCKSTIDIGLYRPDRFGIVDPASPAIRDRCAAARAGKSRGNLVHAAPQ